MSTTPGTELAKYSGEKYAILKQDISALPAILEANIGAGQAINEFDMDRVGIPGGGGLAWSVPDLNGEPEAVPELVGVILLHGDRRAYWKIGFDESGGGTPPDCSSMDGRTGIGYIRGEEKENGEPKTRACKTCPMAQWGSGDFDDKGQPLPKNKCSNGQACTQRKVVFLLRQGDVLPLIVDLAPTSIKAFTQFMLRLTSKGIPCYGAVVGLKLRNENSNTGIKYSVVSPRLISTLPDEDITKMSQIAAAMKPYFDKTGVVASPEASA